MFPNFEKIVLCFYKKTHIHTSTNTTDISIANGWNKQRQMATPVLLHSVGTVKVLYLFQEKKSEKDSFFSGE